MQNDRQNSGTKSAKMRPAKIEQTAGLQKWFNDSNLISDGTCVFFSVTHTVRPASNVHSLYPPFSRYLRIIHRSARAYGSFGLELRYGRHSIRASSLLLSNKTFFYSEA